MLAPLVLLPIGAVVLLARSDAAAREGAAPRSPAGRGAPRSVAPAAIVPTAGPPAPQPVRASRASAAAPAPPVAGRATEDLLAALRRSDLDGARETYLRLLRNPSALRDRAFVQGLLAVAADPAATASSRQVALDLVRRAPDPDAALLASVQAIAVSSALDADTRTRAIDLLHQLASGHDALEAPLRVALLDAAERSPTGEARALAVDAVPTANASDEDVARVTAYLADADAQVRASAARALEASSVRARGSVEAALERSLGAEGDPDVAATLIESALRVGRGDAAAILGRMAETAIVRANAGLARQITDYRSSLAAGETDPAKVQNEHAAREESLLRSR
jgi:hypothetical protein